MYFNRVIGQEKLKSRLAGSVKKGFIPHAQLFFGAEGAGALPLALAYARYLNCTGEKGEDACGSCPSCIKFDKLAHPDVHFVFPVVKNDKKKKEVCDDFLVEWRSFLSENTYFSLSQWLDYLGSENSQGMIYAKESNEIIRKLTLKTYEAEYKIMIIWLPEKMHEACSNKLLKIIEEPPSKTVFLLVSENPDQVLGTIQSRSQQIHVPPIENEDMQARLESEFDLQGEALESVVHIAGGNYIKALQLLESHKDNEIFLDLFITIMRNSWARDVKNMKLKADYFASLGREKQKAFLVYAQRQIRENFIYKMQIPEINYLNKEEAGFAVKFNIFVNERNVMDFMDELELAEKHISQNVNPRLVFFDLSMKIAVLLKK